MVSLNNVSLIKSYNKSFKKINIDTFFIGIFLLLSPIDYVLGDIITSFSFINIFAIVIIVIRLFKKDFLMCKPYDFRLIIFFYLYNVINILLFSNIMLESIFLLYGLLFFLVITKEINLNDLNYYKKCIFFSIVITIIICFFNINFKESNNRFILSFTRYVDPNYFTCGLIICTAYLMNRIKFRKTIILDIVLAVAIFIIIFASGSRGGLLANLSVVLIYLLFGSKKNLISIIIFCLFLFLTFIIAKGFIPEWILERFSLSSINKDKGSGRLDIWENYWKMIINGQLYTLIFGFGRKNQTIMYKFFYGIEKVPHNMFISILFNTGIIGFLFLIYIFFYFIKISIKNKNIFSLSILSGLIFSGLTLDMNITRTFWLVLMIVYISNFKLYSFKEKSNEIKHNSTYL